MLLAIDVGNTNSVFALFDEVTDAQTHAHDEVIYSSKYRLLETWRIATSTSRTADEYAGWLHQMMRLRDHTLGDAQFTNRLADINQCVIATVVPQSLFHMRNLSRRYFNCDAVVVDSAAIPNVEVKIGKPSEVGADRLVNAVGAHIKYDGPLIVVDSGTATTFDVIDANGAFIGGLISPGINLSMQALHDAAARLPRIAIQQPEKVIGTDTVGAMQAGVFWGYIGLIEGLIARIKSEYKLQNTDEMKVIATGGISSLFEGHTDKIDHFDNELTIRGLIEIYDRLLSVNNA